MTKNWHYWSVFVLHAALVSVALILAWQLRFDFSWPTMRWVISLAPLLVLIRWAALSLFKQVHVHWRYTSASDLKDLFFAVSTGSVLFYLAVREGGFSVMLPTTVCLIEALLSFLGMAVQRLTLRTVLQARDAAQHEDRTRVLIIGAGSAAMQLLQALKGSAYRVVGLLDDDPSKLDMRLNGVPVLGKIQRLTHFARKYDAAEVLVAIPSASGSEMLRIADCCTTAGLPFRAVPSLGELIDGRVEISELRKINVEELLGRDPVRLELDNARLKLKGRAVMVTGAAGSIGSELCRQILRCGPSKLICVDRAETPLFFLQQNLVPEHGTEIHYSVADVTNILRMSELLTENGVEAVFHAAANKHVPLTESNPYEGLHNNVFGLLDFVETAEECSCKDFLLISTDKAVNPTSFMGCTKRMGELIVGSRPTEGMRCVSVRFGNVLGSQGSVVPLFQEQIRTRRRLTVTHPEMTRFFMTIPEAVTLVLQAFTVGEHGNILVLDMGEPVCILDLARTVIRVSGFREEEIRIEYTGMRPGEKLYEELFYDAEERLPTALTKVFRAQGHLLPWPELCRHLAELQLIPCGQNGARVRAKVQQIIPEYVWDGAEEASATQASGRDAQSISA